MKRKLKKPKNSKRLVKSKKHVLKKKVKKAEAKAKKAKPAKPLTKLEKALKVHASEINELIDRGRPRGFVTDNEILYSFPKIEDNAGLLDEIYDRLEKAVIKVIDRKSTRLNSSHQII